MTSTSSCLWQLSGVILALLSVMSMTFVAQGQEKQTGPLKIGLVIHGGAGVILRSNLTPEVEQEYKTKLMEAISAGYEALKNARSSLDAVETVLKILEDSPLFNAGKGAVFTHEGTIELDASMMDGRTLKAGAVAAVKHIKNPISLARLVMERSPHVMMVGEGAEVFAKEQGMSFVAQDYFFTERRWNQLQDVLEKAKKSNDSSSHKKLNALPMDGLDAQHGTVGCVALDKFGNLAAGTSTGGMTNKRFGRVGDSPIVGAGTYANNRSCAVSATGDGEFFIRSVVGHDISALMEYEHLSVQRAAETVMEKVGKLGGTGGVIAIDGDGNVGISFNSPGMYRATIDGAGRAVVKIFEE